MRARGVGGSSGRVAQGEAHGRVQDREAVERVPLLLGPRFRLPFPCCLSTALTLPPLRAPPPPPPPPPPPLGIDSPGPLSPMERVDAANAS